MDMRKFSSGFIKPDNVRDAPFRGRIVNIYTSEKYDRPVLVFDSGDEFTVNETNNKILIKAYGFESDDWIGQEIELSLGHYNDWKTDPPTQKETVLVRPISVRQPSPDNGGTKVIAPMPRSSGRDALDDEIPF